MSKAKKYATPKDALRRGPGGEDIRRRPREAHGLAGHVEGLHIEPVHHVRWRDGRLLELQDLFGRLQEVRRPCGS